MLNGKIYHIEQAVLIVNKLVIIKGDDIPEVRTRFLRTIVLNHDSDTLEQIDNIVETVIKRLFELSGSNGRTLNAIRSVAYASLAI
jgi:hypothetical protein